jgi:hypothetical protein
MEIDIDPFKQTVTERVKYGGLEIDEHRRPGLLLWMTANGPVGSILHLVVGGACAFHYNAMCNATVKFNFVRIGDYDMAT